MRELVRVLEVRLEFVADDVERRELLRRIAELRDERLTDDAGAFEAYARLLPLSPGRRRGAPALPRDRARGSSALERGRRRPRSSRRRTPRLRSRAPRSSATWRRSTRRASQTRSRRGDLSPGAGARARRSVHRAARGARARAHLRRSAARAASSRDVLRVQVKLEEQRRRPPRAPTRRLGTLAEETLSDDAAAIAAWKRALEDDPADDEALAALDRLYERERRPPRARRGPPRARAQRGRRRRRARRSWSARRRRSPTLGDVAEAILAYRAVLDDFGADREVLGALAALYEKAERWPDLAETLEADLALADDAGRSDRSSSRAWATSAASGSARSRRRSRRIARRSRSIRRHVRCARGARGAARRRQTRAREAAEILRPLYEASGADDEARFACSTSRSSTRAGSRRASSCYARARRRSPRARSSDPAQGVRVRVARPPRVGAASRRSTTWIARAERLAERDRQATPSSSSSIATSRRDILDEDQQVAVTLRIAELARTKLSRRRAREAVLPAGARAARRRARARSSRSSAPRGGAASTSRCSTS